MIEILSPRLPESVKEGVLLSWKVRSGGVVNSGELIAEIETDKVILEVFAPRSGTLLTLKEEGEALGSEEVIAKMELHEEPPATTPKEDESKEAELEPTLLMPTLKLKPEEPPKAPRRERLSPLRRVIAERLVAAQKTAASVTTYNQVDLTHVNALRKEFGPKFEEKHGLKLNLSAFFIKASAMALMAHPKVNASIEGDEVVYHPSAHIGVAISTEQGLVVPVIREVEKLDLLGVEREIQRLSKAARERTLKPEEVLGATFSVTNGGIFGSLLSTPILVPPQSAVLGMHAIEDRPVVRDGQIVIRPMMYLALSYDHRLLDGRDAILFVNEIRRTLEAPEGMLLNA